MRADRQVTIPLDRRLRRRGKGDGVRAAQALDNGRPVTSPTLFELGHEGEHEMHRLGQVYYRAMTSFEPEIAAMRAELDQMRKHLNSESDPAPSESLTSRRTKKASPTSDEVRLRRQQRSAAAAARQAAAVVDAKEAQLERLLDDRALHAEAHREGAEALRSFVRAMMEIYRDAYLRAAARRARSGSVAIPSIPDIPLPPWAQGDDQLPDVIRDVVMGPEAPSAAGRSSTLTVVNSDSRQAESS